MRRYIVVDNQTIFFIGYYINEYRIENKLTKRELSKKLGISLKETRKILNGKMNASEEVIKRFAELNNIKCELDPFYYSTAQFWATVQARYNYFKRLRDGNKRIEDDNKN